MDIAIAEKADADQFRRRIQVLKSRARLGSRQWWPNYLFHFADISNVISILQAGELMSRAQVEGEGGFIDSASPDIIHQTKEDWKDYVRFYFRPRTPTLYRNEGFRPGDRRHLGGAHCPVPVYLLFDFESVICREDSLFSFGSLARKNAEVFNDASHFEQMPFELIYHDSRFEAEERSQIIFHRQAEVVVPQTISTDYIRMIWCRSQAEYDTLRHELPSDLWVLWKDRITARTDYNLFNREWIYVDHAYLDHHRALFRFNPPRSIMDVGLFDVRIEVAAQDKQYLWHVDDAGLGRQLQVDLTDVKTTNGYTLRVYLDGYLAYAGTYTPENLPF
jgi:hypothetical protein